MISTESLILGFRIPFIQPVPSGRATSNLSRWGILSLLLLTGCAAFQNTNTRAQVAEALSGAAQTGTRIYLSVHPERRTAFVQAVIELQALSELSEPSPAQLHAILSKLPISELNGTTAQIVVGGAETVYRIFLAGRPPVEVPPAVKEFSLALAKGINAGMK